MNNQQFFDVTVAHLRKQGGPATEGARCAYLARDGSKCAIGCHIPSDVYKRELEEKSAATLMAYFPEVAKIFEGVGSALIDEMQKTHDNIRPPHWEAHFEDTARRFSLTLAEKEPA